MKIRLLGLDFQPGKGISLADLFSYIASKQGTSLNFHGYERLLYIEEIKEFHVGLLITTKDQKKFLELTQDSGNVKIEPRDVTEGAQLADFNFFLIHKKTGRGIYQYYHNSCALNPFAYLCRKHYDELKQAKIEQMLGLLKAPTEGAKSKVRKQYSGTLKWVQIVRPEAFDALIKTLSKIHSFSVTMSTLSQEEKVFRPLSLLAKKVSHEFKFSDDSTVSAIGDNIRSVIDKLAPDSGRVEGIDSDGLEQIIKLTNNPDSFGEFDYDNVAEKMNFSPKEFATSWFMKEIVKIVESKPALFITKTSA